MPKSYNFHTIISQLSNCVSTLSPAAIHLFNILYRGGGEEDTTSKNVNSDESGDEINVISIANILNSTNNPLIRAKKIIEFIDKIFVAVEKATVEFKNFARSDEMNKKFEGWCEDHLKTCIEGCLLLKEALDNGVFSGGGKKIKEEKVARKMVNFFLGWRENGAIMSEKLGEFNVEKEIVNIGLFQQLCGGIPIAPIADSIMPFSMLEWQKNMFMALRKRVNVIVSAPTSSGKTMIALGYIIAFLMNEPKSVLVYVVPNNVLALEISAILNRFIEGKVSIILDKDSERKQDERTIVVTPSGAIQSGFIESEMPANALLIIDEIHTILGNIELEVVLREMSKIQTLLLSATISEDMIEKLAGVINNRLEKVVIKESTQFIVAQDMIPRAIRGAVSLVSINPICNMNNLEEVRRADLSMTARDVTVLFNRIMKKYGAAGTPEYLAPIPFFCKYGCGKPEGMVRFIDDDGGDEEDEDEEEEEATGIVRRLTMNDIQKWQKILIEFLIEKEDGIILQSYRNNDFDVADITTPKNAFLIIEECKKKDMFPALFFFKSLYGAIYYTGEIIKLLDGKQPEMIVREKKSNVRALEKQIASLSKMKGNGKELRARRERMEFELQQSVHSEMISVSDYKCLSKDGGISPEEFRKYVEMLKAWNKKFTQSHLMAQMVLYGIGILSGDMPFDLQVFIRGLFNGGIIVLLMTTADCAYGINTPTKTVIVGDGIGELDRKQMKGRAGRKGLGFKAFYIQEGGGNCRSPLTPPCGGNCRSPLTPPCQVGQEMEGGQEIEGGQESEKYNRRDKNNAWGGKGGTAVPPTWGGKGGTAVPPLIYHYDLDVYEKFRSGYWINEEFQHILYSKEDYEIDKEFYKRAYLMFGLGAIVAPSILKELIKETTSDSNRNIRIILGLIGCIPQNKPYVVKEEWEYQIPEKVVDIYRENGVLDFHPNWFAYQWLMNQKSEFTFTEKEECIGNGKYWSYLIFLLSPIFRKVLGEGKGEELYNDIQGLITNSIINM